MKRKLPEKFFEQNQRAKTRKWKFFNLREYFNMKRKLPEKFFEQNQRAKTRKWKFFNLNQTLWGAGNREFRCAGLFYRVSVLANSVCDISCKSPLFI